MAKISTLKMSSDGVLTVVATPFRTWVENLVFDSQGVTYEGTIPKSMIWGLYYDLKNFSMGMGYNMEISEHSSAVTKMLRIDAISSKLEYDGNPIKDCKDPFDWDDVLLMNNLTSDLTAGDTVTHLTRHGWIGLKPFHKDHPIFDDVEYYFKFDSYTRITLYDVDKSKISSLSVEEFEAFLDKAEDPLFELTNLVKAPSVHIALTPIFEVIGEVNLAKVIKATKKEDKLSDLRLTVSNLGLQSRSKATGDMSEIIQETLHEIAEHHEIGDVLIAVSKNITLGSLVLKNPHAKNAYDQNQQIGILARESGGVVLPTTPLLSTVKDMILIKPI